MTRADYSTKGRKESARADRDDSGQETVRPLSILHLHQKTSLSTGSVQQMMQAAGGLRARGHHVMAVAPPSAEISTFGAELDLDVSAEPFAHIGDLKTVIGLRRLIRRERPDVIHVHKGRAHWLAMVALAGDPHPVLIANRGVSFPLTLWNRGKYRSSRTDRVITVCEAIRDMIRTSGKVDPKKIDVVYAGTDMARFDRRRLDPVRFREQEGIPLDAFVILQSGTRRWKGWKEVVDAFGNLRSTAANARLLIVGNDGAERENKVRSYVSDRGLSDFARVLGYRPDIEHVLAAADVTVDASWEGTGITGTVRESMAVGTAVIATDCGGNRELIRDPQLGWLIGRQDRARLLAALREAHADPEKRQKIAEAAERFVRPNFSIERRIDRLESIYFAAVRARRELHLSRAAEETAGYPG
ncbi:MAG: glycosyltransferase family 4 protein [Acidobacteria bacterium]|nr:glycosyltransferase family 4 protein [Acidobacteriota bacterium]